MFKRMLIASFAVALVFTACTTYKPFTDKAQAELKTGDGLVIVAQKTLIVSVPQSNSGNTGLLGALVMAGVDAARQADADKKAKPIRDALEGYDFKAEIQDALNGDLGKLSNVDFQRPFELSDSEAIPARRGAYDGSKSDAVMYVWAAYRLEEGQLIISGSAMMLGKNAGLLALSVNQNSKDPVKDNSYFYRRDFEFVQTQKVTPDNIQDNLTQAAKKIAEIVADDLGHPEK